MRFWGNTGWRQVAGNFPLSYNPDLALAGVMIEIPPSAEKRDMMKIPTVDMCIHQRSGTIPHVL